MLRPLLLLLFATMLTACDSASGGSGGCRDSSVCAEDEGCVGPDDTFCGVPPHEECSQNSDCGAGAACHSTYDSCSPDHVGSRCAQPCAQDIDCGTGFVCLADGSCAPTPCDAPGATCLPSETCDPASVDAAAAAPDRRSGCVHIPCPSDDACPQDTFCVNGYCQQGVGMCSPPAA